MRDARKTPPRPSSFHTDPAAHPVGALGTDVLRSRAWSCVRHIHEYADASTLVSQALPQPASAVLEPAISPRLLVVLVHATHSQLLLHDAMAATGDSHGRFLHLAHLPRSSISVAACTTDVRAHGLQAQGTTRLHRPTSTHTPPAALLRRNRARGSRPLAEVARLRAWQQCREIPARVLHASAPRARRAGM